MTAAHLHPLVEEWDADLRSTDPLRFPGYGERAATLEEEAVLTGRTEHYVVVESRFEVLGGSMGAVVGEKVGRAYDRAVAERLPVVAVTRSGGARMQEGMVSLIQMGRTAAAARRHVDAGLLSLAVHRSPTTGGVFASFGSLALLRAVEDGATIGFAGPRVVEQVAGDSVAGRSHSAATALAHGLVDAVVAPGEGARAWVEVALGLRDAPLVVRPLPEAEAEAEPTADGAWGEVLRARRRGRPTGLDHAAAACTSWTDLGGTDPTVRTGLATIAGRHAVVLACDRYAQAGPDGLAGQPGAAAFRQAQRAVALADALGLPLVSFLDTPGADPRPASENDGVAGEIARTFAAMAALRSPSVAVCVGEGGSGGALALGWADRFLIQRHAVFSVIGPEGAAAILERDASRAPQVAEHLALSSDRLLDLGIVDGVVGESTDAVAAAVGAALDEARVGDRDRRTAAVTAAAVTG